ncbi:MAG: hypothetical protein WD097_06625 [Balneolales bacterium]
MKTLHVFLILSLAAVMAVISACENITNPDPINVINEDKVATIRGTVYANLDLTNDTTGVVEMNFERPPAGTNIKVLMDSEDFVASPQPGVNYQKLSYATTVDDSGNYIIEVPAMDTPLNAEIYLDEFSATQVQADSSEESRIFSPAQFPYTVTVSAGFTTHRDIFYNSN